MHGRIYAAAARLISTGRAANPVTLKNLFDQDGALADIGRAQYLARLVDAAVTIINAEDYGRIVFDLAKRRDRIAMLQDTLNQAYQIDLTRSSADIAAILETVGEQDADLIDCAVVVFLGAVCLDEGIEPDRSIWCVLMRTIIATCIGLLALCAISVQAAPLPPAKVHPTGLAVSPPVELVAQGCGYGYKRTQWQDQWGRWHWGRCVPKTWGNIPREQFSH